MPQLYITDLPDSVLLRICEYLPLDNSFFSLASTCNRFLFLLRDFSLWKRRDVQFKTQIPQASLNRLRFFSSKFLRRVDLSGNTQITDTDLVRLLTFFKHITHLDLSRCCNLTSCSLACLAVYPGKLHTLKINGCYWFCPDVVLKVVCVHSASLRALDLTGCSRLTRDVTRVSRMAEACSKLVSLSLACLAFVPNGLNPVLMSPIIDTDVHKFARQCRRLKHLRLSRCHIGDDAISNIGFNCRTLVSLDLSYTYIGNESLQTIGKSFPELKFLQLAGCWKISDQGMNVLAECRLRLTQLNLRRCVDITSLCLAHYLSMTPTIRELNIAHCCSLVDMVVDCIGLCCPKLAVLDVTGTSISQEKLTKLRKKRSIEMLIWDGRRLRK